MKVVLGSEQTKYSLPCPFFLALGGSHISLYVTIANKRCTCKRAGQLKEAERKSVKAGDIKDHLQLLLFPLGSLSHSSRKWLQPHLLIQVHCCVPSNSYGFLEVLAFPYLFKSSHWTQNTMICAIGAGSSVAVQPLLFLMAASWRRSSSKVCSLLLCCLWRKSNCETALFLCLLPQQYKRHWCLWGWYSNVSHGKNLKPDKK